MNILNRNKIQMYLNLFCSVLLLVTNLLINFFLSPFIVEKAGVEAHGFVTLANNFVTYAGLLVQALNSMASRFITIEYHKGNFEKANLFYNSVFWGDLIIICILLIPASCLIIFLQDLLSISSYLIVDVKILFSLVFLTFFIQTGFSSFSVGTYIKNRLDREYFPNLMTALLKGLVLFLFFSFILPTQIWFVGLASLISTFILCLIQVYNTKRLTPYLKLNFKSGTRLCSKNAVKTLLSSGVWNALSSLGTILFNGVDLIVCNLLLGPIEMGILSVAKTLPSISDQLRTSISRIFLPTLTIDFANGDYLSMKRKIDKAMQLSSFFMVIVTVGICVMAGNFYKLWMPEQDSVKLQILVILSLSGYYFTNGISVLFNIFSVTNKVKQNAFAVLISGIVSIVITVLITKFTDFGVFGICAVSTIVSTLKNLLYVIPYSAICIKQGAFTFFPNVLRSFASGLILTIFSFGIEKLIPSALNWGYFILTCIIIGLCGLILDWFIVVKKENRREVYNYFKCFLKKEKKK